MFYNMRCRKKLRMLLGDLRNTKLPVKDIDYALELVSYNENDVALEHICDQLYEYDVSISRSIFKQILDIAYMMNMGEDTLKFMDSLIENNF